jgi:ABC-type transport system involved in multi-copper enzyme maturation permease subunit
MATVMTIARLTFQEASRRRIVWIALLMGLAFLTVFGLGVNAIHSEINKTNGLFPSDGTQNKLMLTEINNFLTLAGLYVVNFLTNAMAVLTSVDTLSGEVATGTIHTLLSKPVRRWQIVLGKWLGFVGMLTVYLALMGGGVMLIVNFIGQYLPPNAERGLLLLWLNSMLLLTFALCGGSRLSTLANGALAFSLYGIAFVGGWIEQIGAILKNQTAINIGVVSSLLLPSEALWRRAAYEMQSPLAGAIGFSPFSANSVPSPLMLGYAVLYLIVAFLLAVRIFSKRDL